MAQTAQDTDVRRGDTLTPESNLESSPMMAHLLKALRAHKDIGHYGRLVFVMVARHFMNEDEMVRLLSRQPDFGEDEARSLVTQVKARGNNPPRREKILQWQSQQDFPIIPDAQDRDSGNVYRELRFPEGVYEEIEEYYEDKAEAA
jgi:hypothetical protein